MSGVISYTIPNAHSGSIYSLKLLPSGYVASGGSDGYIKQWNMETYTYSFVTDMYFPGMTYLTMDVDSSGFIYSGANYEVIIVNPTNQAVQNFGSPFPQFIVSDYCQATIMPLLDIVQHSIFTMALHRLHH